MNTGHVSDGDMGRAWRDKEAAVESQYFSKHDKEILMKMAEKIERQAKPSSEQLMRNKEMLEAILRKHNVVPALELVDDILAFKYGKFPGDDMKIEL